jgi:glutamate racemase
MRVGAHPSGKLRGTTRVEAWMGTVDSGRAMSSSSDLRARPIGVFDSGVGGLTVLGALRERLPREHLVYLGDTARLPYGTKSPETVRRYAEQAADRLVERGVKMLVIACNTASAVGLAALREHFAPLPVIGVIEPGAEAACSASSSGRILVTGTESTIAGGAYQRAILARRPEARISTQACGMFVALAEEGWVDGPVALSVVRRYLDPSLLGPEGEGVDCIVLGCTHFPVLRRVIGAVAGPEVALVDSAKTTAVAVEEELHVRGLERGPSAGPGEFRLMATDAPERFARAGEIFLGGAIRREEVQLVDL